MRPSGLHRRCHGAAAAAAAAGKATLKLHEGCAHFSVGGYVVSWRGAKKLAEAAAPLAAPVDTFVLRRIQAGTVDAFAVLPPVAHVDAYGTSDSVRRYVTVSGNDVHFTYAEDAGELTCFNSPCQISIRA